MKNFYFLYMADYSSFGHTKCHIRYHIVWITKYRYKVLTNEMRLRVREVTRQICNQLGVRILDGVLSSNHIHMFVEIPPRVSVSDYMRRVKGCTSRRIQQEFPHIRKRYWGRKFWARGYFCTTSGNVTNEIIEQYIQNHQED